MSTPPGVILTALHRPSYAGIHASDRNCFLLVVYISCNTALMLYPLFLPVFASYYAEQQDMYLVYASLVRMETTAVSQCMSHQALS